jgi:hypothetical protein
MRSADGGQVDLLLHEQFSDIIAFSKHEGVTLFVPTSTGEYAICGPRYIASFIILRPLFLTSLLDFDVDEQLMRPQVPRDGCCASHKPIFWCPLHCH